MIEWWIKKGVNGFRIDAISYLEKPAGFPDSTKPVTHKDGYVMDAEITSNLPGTHKLINEMNSVPEAELAQEVNDMYSNNDKLNQI